MKKLVLLSFLLQISFGVFSQSISINTDNLQLPRVSALPACAAADYGKVVFLTTTNKANVCSGSGWVEIATSGGGGSSLTLPYSSTGSFSTQGFQIVNNGGGANSAAIQGTTFSSLTDAAGLWGSANTTTPTGFNAGVRGSNFATNNYGYGVVGTHAGSGIGVYGVAATGIGVAGATSGSNSIAVRGNAIGVNSAGIFGTTNQSTSIGGFFENTSATGLALLTNGKFRFQGNGAATNKILVSSDANGTAVWGNPTRTEVLKLGPSDFQSHISTNESTIGNLGISMTTAAGSFHATVSVPDGATITSYKIYYLDNDGVSPAVGLGLTSYAFQKLNMGLGFLTLYSNLSNGNFTNVPYNPNGNILSVTQTLPTPELVDNDTTFYRLVVTMPASTNLILIGADIRYTYPINN